MDTHLKAQNADLVNLLSPSVPHAFSPLYVASLTSLPARRLPATKHLLPWCQELFALSPARLACEEAA